MVCAIVDLYYISTSHKILSLPHDKALRPYLLTNYILSLILNIVATGMYVSLWEKKHVLTNHCQDQSCIECGH